MPECKDETDNNQIGKKRHVKGLLVLGLALLALAGVGGATLAKYVTSARQSALAEAAGFYFSSNYLTTAGKEYDIYITDWNAPSFTVDLFNHKNGNTAAMNVGYTVTVVGGTINGSATAAGTIAVADNSVTLTIVPVGGKDSEVIVSVKTAPYEQTLYATFNLKDPEGKATYTFTDNGYYCTLAILTGDMNIDSLTINYGDGLAPDSTDERMPVGSWIVGPDSGTLSGTAGNPAMVANGTYTLLFFDTGNTTHSTTSGVIMENRIAID